MADIIDISSLRKQWEEKKAATDWKDFANVAYKALEDKCAELELANTKLKQLEATISLLPKKIAFAQITDEELICIEQLAGLRIKSRTRELSLEETKKLDILVKSLKLIREENPKDNISTSTSIEEDDLVSIAAGKTHS